MVYQVEIVPYDSQWPELFTHIGSTLRHVLGALAVRIDHIGSTAVPLLAAKPILDVQISVQALEPVHVYKTPLEQAGYVFRADNPELTKRYFREAPGQRRTHIHVRRAGSWAEQFALLFRDYLRTHPEAAQHYATAKYQLAQHYRDDRHGYTDAKGPIIWALMQQADQWSQTTGWEPAQSDC